MHVPVYCCPAASWLHTGCWLILVRVTQEINSLQPLQLCKRGISVLSLTLDAALGLEAFRTVH